MGILLCSSNALNQGIHALLNQCPKLTHLSLTGVQAFFLREDLDTFCRDAPPGKAAPPLPLYIPFTFVPLLMPGLEFTDHQRNVFCVFSGEGVNRLRNYLNETHLRNYLNENQPSVTYDTEGTMYDDRDGDDGDPDQQVTGLMHATGLGADDDDMDDEVDVGDESQYGGEMDG